MLRNFVYFLVIITLCGCSSISYKHVPKRTDDANREFYLFLDGTANDATSRTNVAKLHSLITLQNQPNVATLYVDGVGTERTGKFLGLGVGVGNAKRVREAYLFLAENYRPDDKIYIFGFSRGAWSARVLSAMLYAAGLPDVNHLSDSRRKAVVKDIYNKYKKYWSTFGEDNRTLAERRKAVIDYLKDEDLDTNHIKNVEIKFLGLWDTVQALGLEAHNDTNVGEPNERYADQLCNIHRIAHAVSLDDYRFEQFTPLLYMQSHFNKQECIAEDNKILTKLNEVWFSGAHSDVGGGYDDTAIDGVSLNWMLSELKDEKIIDKDIKVYANPFDKTHNANQGLLGLFVYSNVTRDLNAIYRSGDYVYPNSSIGTEPKKAKIKLHQSVLDRLCVKAPEPFESHWFREGKFKGCVVCQGNIGSISNKDTCADALEIAKDTLYKPVKALASENMCKISNCQLSRDKDGISTVRNENPIKSCNLFLPETKRQAQQRLVNKKLDGKEHSEVTITYFNDRKNDHTGVMLKKGLKYRITIEDSGSNQQEWSDCSYESGLKGRSIWSTSRTEKGWYSNFLLKAGSVIMWPTNEYIFENLTTLIGQVNGHSIVFHEVLASDLINDDSSSLLKGTFTLPVDGELVLTVNEPIWNNFAKGEFFSNNSGFVTFKLEVAEDAN